MADFTCHTTGHPAPQKFFWSVNNGPEEEGFAVKRIKSVRRAKDEPIQVICRAETEFNGNLYSSSSMTSLSVLWGPTLRIGMKKEEVIQLDEDEPISLECSFSGYPKPVITWVLYQNGQGVENKYLPRTSRTRLNTQPKISQGNGCVRAGTRARMRKRHEKLW